MFWELVSLNEIRIESIKNEDIIIFRCVTEIRPVKSISHIVFVLAGVDVSYIFLHWVF